MKNWAYQYYRSKLDEKSRLAYDLVYRAWFTQKETVSLPPLLVDDKAVSGVVDAVIKDNPSLFWINYYQYVIRRSLLKTELIFRFFFNSEEIKRYATESNAWKSRVVSKVPQSFSNTNKAWLLFDFLARQVTYGKQAEAFSQTIVGPISKNNHVSVCEGIAKSYKYLCDETNIPCIVVFGDADFGPGNRGPHAWNIIETEAGKKHVDVTAELHSAHRWGKATRTRFLHSDREMSEEYLWDRLITPACN